MTEQASQATLESLRLDFESGRNPLGYVPYATALLDEKRFSRALEVCLRGLEMRPALAGRHLLARIYYSMGRYEDSNQILKEVLESAPGSFSANLLHAQVLTKRGYWDEAVQTLRRLSKLNPTDQEVVRLYEEVRAEIERKTAGLNSRKIPAAKRPGNFGDFKRAITERIAAQPEIDFGFFTEARDGNPAEAQGTEDIMGIILEKSQRICRELQLGDLCRVMMDFDEGYVLASRCDGEFLVAKFSPDAPPGRARATMDDCVALNPSNAEE